MSPLEPYHVLERNLALEMARVTEAAALAASRHMGRGDERAAVRAASRAMRAALNGVGITGRVVIGDHDPGCDADTDPDCGLGDGMPVGTRSGPSVEIAAQPLEGATICATGMPNSLSLLALAEAGGFAPMPPGLYMDKIAVGSGVPDGALGLDRAPGDNVRALAEVRGVRPADLVVCILERPRNEGIITAVREAGARIQLIQDGDVSGIIATTDPESGVDMLMGSGGAREGILSAAAMACLGGWMQGRPLARTEAERSALREAGLDPRAPILALSDMVRGDVMFAATGVTDSAVLRGVRRWPDGATTHSLVARTKSGTVRRIEARHDLRRKAAVAGADDPA
ncbi:fructose-bisphosphatase class II family protein [Roseospira goensis]|uniref:Fructose-1,6-bisphosphatase n=1 Tax=Roseospira goensis TaxID=391922 RepID=A0A7W6WJ07_9PROT|nr:fructose-bisphosphatase class II family protein [Roseospira goensis]MBB4284731.1 fructose-1,6-bisphosphatase II / sedoheptulose-1,7-bisphosphatase [Roseospira goensis]